MGFGKIAPIIAFCLIFSGMALAVPGIPHQFYGYVTINQVPADGANIVAKINNVEKAGTSSVNGNYGFAPDIFYVPDPNSSNAGKTIDFFLNGTKVASHVFANGETTRLDLFIGEKPACGDGICNLDEDAVSCAEDCGTGPVCGDSVCDADEDCSSCEQDCGECVPVCGDGTCNGEENNASCAADCPPTGPYCGDTVCNSDLGESCSTCPADCGACASGGGGSLGGGSGGGGGGGGAPKLKFEVGGKCINAPIEVTVMNSVGNPAADATIKVVRDFKTVAEETSDKDGKASFTLAEAGDYIFYVTKRNYTQSSKTITINDCPGGQEPVETVSGSETENLCANVDCDDKNPCTSEFCVAGTGHCGYENQPDGLACPGGACLAGACKEPEREVQEVPGPVGFFGLGSGQSVGLGILILGLLGLLALLLARGRGKSRK